MEIANGNSSKFVFSTVAILRRRISTKTLLVSIRYEANIQLWLVLFKDKLMMSSFHHRQPKLRLRAAHKLDCFFHAMHNNDIGNI